MVGLRLQVLCLNQEQQFIRFLSFQRRDQIQKAGGHQAAQAGTQGVQEEVGGAGITDGYEILGCLDQQAEAEAEGDSANNVAHPAHARG